MKAKLKPIRVGAGWRAAGLACLLCAPVLNVWGADALLVPRFEIHQPERPLSEALKAISRQTGRSLLFNPVQVDGRIGRAISGHMSAEEAVSRLLQGTGLVAAELAGALVVRPATVAAPVPAASSPPSAAPPAKLSEAPPAAQRFAQAGSPVVNDAGPTGAAPARVASERQRVEVTGSRLKRIDAEAALPVNVYTRADIERSGQSTLTRFLSGLNEVSVGQGEGSFTGPVQGQGTVQLRGLPLGSTLVLINGRRVQAVGSSAANFFNLNLIPLAAVERVEVVPVGSSAVYGGDALGGVVNIILRKSIDGLSLSARATSGAGFGDGGLSVGVGGGGERDGWMLLGSYSKSTPLQTEERAFFRDADYRRLGGVDARGQNCVPGTVTNSISANLPGLNAPVAGIPANATGQALTVQNFAATAGRANLCANFALNGSATLFHELETLGLHASGYRSLSDTWTGFAEVTLAREESYAESEGLNLTNVLVPATNPNNPFGVPVRVTARLGVENGREANSRHTNFARVLTGLRGELGAGWDFEGTASLSRDQGARQLVNNIVSTAGRTAALATADSAASLNPFTSGRAASDQVLRSIWSNEVRTSFGRKVTAAAFARGPMFELPAGPVETIVGGEVARDDYRSVQTSSRFLTQRDTGAVYGELRAPLWKLAGPGNEPGRTLAALTLAGRRDRYSDFGSADTYQAGIELRPQRTLLLRASGATSFKPPTLLQTNVPDSVFALSQARLVDPARGGVPVTEGQYVRGANPDLQPETGKAFALGALWEPDAANGSRYGITAWEVKIDSLIGILSSQTVLNNEVRFPGFVTRGPAVDGVPGAITRMLISESNFGFVQTRGLDLEASHAWRSPWGRWSLAASATRVTDYSVSITPGAPVLTQLGRRFAEYWAPKWKARLSVGLDEGSWGVGLTSRYLGSYKDTQPSDRNLGNTWTHDLSARLDLGRLGVKLGAAKAASVSLVVVNASNVLPAYASGLPYFDTSQGDWRGRYASVRLSADW